MSSIEEVDGSDFCTTCMQDQEGYRAQIYYENERGFSVRKVVWIDPSTKNCYRDDPESVLRQKCGVLFFASIVYCICYVSYYAARTSCKFVQALEASYRDFSREKITFSRSIFILATLVHNLLYETFLGVGHVCRGVFASVAIAALSVIGLALPYFARIQIGYLEACWHQGGREFDIRYPGKKESCFDYVQKGFWEGGNRAIFIAYCFQPVKNLDRDPITRLDLLKSSGSVVVLDETLQSKFSDFLPLLNRE